VYAGASYYDLFSSAQNTAFIIGGACVGLAMGLLSCVPLARLRIRA
jgi:hypothetical protein